MQYEKFGAAGESLRGAVGTCGGGGGDVIISIMVVVEGDLNYDVGGGNVRKCS